MSRRESHAANDTQADLGAPGRPRSRGNKINAASRPDFASSQWHNSRPRNSEPEPIPFSGERDRLPDKYFNGPQQGYKPSNWGNPEQIAAILSLRGGHPVGTDSSTLRVSSLQAPALNSSMQLRQKAIDLSSSSVDREIVEDEIRMEMQRMREDDIDEVEQHPPITWKEHEEAFRDLVPVASQETDKVLRPKALGKQIDPKWQSSLLVKPSFELFSQALPDRQLRGAMIPPIPSVNLAPPPLDACSPMLASSYFDLPFSAADLRVVRREAFQPC